MELKINEYQLPEQILFNYEELKQELTEKVHHYETLVYTEDQIKEAKTDRANLNKLKKALNDERIRREREYLEPFNAFKTQINEIIAIIDKPVAVIDSQVKTFEDKQKAEKKVKIEELFNSIGFQSFVKLEKLWDEKWLNSSVTMKKIEEELNAHMYRIGNELFTISKLPEFAFEAEEVYKVTLDINKSISEAQRMSEVAKAKAEREAAMRKIEEEQKAKAAEAEFAKAMNPPVEAVAPTEEEIHTTPGEAQIQKQWVIFQALLTTEEAVALREFFNSRNIEFKAV